MKYVTFVGPHPAKSTVIIPKPAVERSGQKTWSLFCQHLYPGASLRKPDHWAVLVHVENLIMCNKV